MYSILILHCCRGIYLFYTFYFKLKKIDFNTSKFFATTAVPILFNILISLEVLETLKNNEGNKLTTIKNIIIVDLTAVC